MDSINKWDTDQIQRIMSAYCRYIDTKQWESLITIIADDARLEFQDVGGNTLYAFTGPLGLVKASKDAITEAVTVHHLHNPEISCSDDQHASAVWAMEDRFYKRDSSGRSVMVFHGIGHYHVTFMNQSGNWKITALKLTRLRLEEYQAAIDDLDLPDMPITL